ncbi:hypothetical protein [Streptomyces sp. NPDC004533]|uniref:hypothetical protein n=1 Tax=Streptomyces sp. NPDC004533 TaxID=3154278 RepID=UPI0033ABBB5B
MHLGPLQQGDDGLWALGDSAIGAKGGYVKLLPEGAEHWWRGSREVLVPWSRFMSLDGLEVTPRRIGSSRTVGVVNTLGGAGTVGMLGSCLTVTLRHPYEVWVAQFSHHQRRYGWHHLALVEELLRQAIQAGEAERLGDPDWLDWWSSFSSRSVPGPRGA